MRDPERFPPIKPEHAQAIGYVAFHWSLIEEQLGFIIFNLLNLHSILGAAATAELSTLNRISTIGAFINLTGNKTWIDKWGAIATDLDDLRNRRNDVVHSAWQFRGLEHRRSRTKARGQLVIQSGPVATEDLIKLSDEILGLVDKIDALTLTLIQAGAWKIINQFHPPGWKAPSQIQGLSPRAPVQTPNPKRARQQVSRAQRRANALTSKKK
jgi:hypothetical protein